MMNLFTQEHSGYNTHLRTDFGTLCSLEWVQTESEQKHKDRLVKEIMWVRVPSNREEI